MRKTAGELLIELNMASRSACDLSASDAEPLTLRVKLLYLLSSGPLTPVELMNRLCMVKSNLALLTAKMVNSGAFVVLGILFAAVSGHISYLTWILPALALCFLGDFFIGLFRKNHKSRHFMLGLIFFLAAHLGFSLFLLILNPGIDLFNVGLPLAAGAAFLLLERLCGLKMRKLRWPAFFYALLLTFFMVNAVKFALDQRSAGAMWIGAGAVLFFASDVSIIFLYFHTFQLAEQKTAVHIFNLATYYLGILGILIGLGTLCTGTI